MQISLVQVPYMMGDERCGSSRGPGRFLQAGADQLLSSRGLHVSLESVERGTPFRRQRQFVPGSMQGTGISCAASHSPRTVPVDIGRRV